GGEPGVREELRDRGAPRRHAGVAAHPGQPRAAPDQERLRVLGEEPRQDPGGVEQALRGEDRAQVTAFLELRDICKEFGSFVALKRVSLEVNRGELICFLGPSGCGKTTLLRIIAGLEVQTSGSVIQAGRDISRLPPMERDYGIVFQSYALFPNLTIADNVAYGLVNRGTARAERAARVAELLGLVGLPESGPKYPAQLSGGQQQRVALARAL